MFIIIGLVVLLCLIKLFFGIFFFNEKWSRKAFIVISGAFLFLISATRSIYFTTDVEGYVSKYLSLGYVDISTLLQDFFDPASKDTLFYLCAKIINELGVSYQIWLAVIAALFCYSVSKIIYEYSDEACISFIAVISLGYFYFSLSGLRQSIALSIIILSYKYLREKRLLTFILMVLLGALFHSSAIIFLCAYPLANMNVGWKQILGIVFVIAVAQFFSGNMIELLGSLGMTGRYDYYIENENKLSISGFIIQLCIYFFCLCYKKRVLKLDKKNISLYNLLFCGLAFQSFATVIAEFFRVSMYFSIFSIVLIPKAISTEKDFRLRIILYVSVFFVLTAYIFWRNSFDGFSFFLQEG